MVSVVRIVELIFKIDILIECERCGSNAQKYKPLCTICEDNLKEAWREAND